MSKQIFSLSQVTKSIETTLRNRYGSPFWVKAEMNRLNWYPHSGHAYPDLLEKKDGRVIAQLRGIIWKSDYDRIQASFKEQLGEPLKEGVEILFLCQVTYSGTYGLSLQIRDIDVQYHLGSLEKERQATIDLLKKENIFHLNKQLPFPTLPQRIAIISVETSKGFGDFKKALVEQWPKYKYYYKLFPAILQGDRAVTSIRFQLQKIKKELENFDVVVITRGGGDEVGLSAFNHIDLVRDVATFPLPVLTGIGHATNLSVIDMVAYYHAITPTQIAQYLIDYFDTASQALDETSRLILNHTNRLIHHYEKKTLNTQKVLQLLAQKYLIRLEHSLESMAHNIEKSSQYLLKDNEQALKNDKKYLERMIQEVFENKQSEWLYWQEDWENSVLQILKSKQKDLNHIEDRIQWMDPKHILKRGFTMLHQDGKIITQGHLLTTKDFQIQFADASITVEPLKIKINE